LHPEYNFNITKEEFNNFDIEPNKPFLEELNKRSNEIDIYNYFIVRSKYGRDNYINHGIDPARIFINQLGIDHEKFVPNNKYTEERKKTEAISSGVPVITTPVGAETIREGENGFIIPFRSVEAIKEKILFFYNNPDKAIEMGKKARQIAKEYTWDNYKERLINIIKEINEKS
jgi:hypothetical protein